MKLKIPMYLSLLFAGSTLLIFRPVFSGRIIVSDFMLYHQYPYLALWKSGLEEFGRLVIWSPLLLGGFPVFLAQQSSLFLNVLMRFFDYIFTYNLLVFFSFFLSLVFSYIFARSLFLSKAASIIVAFSYTFSQLFMFLGSMVVFGTFMPFVPLLFFCIFKSSQSSRGYVFLILGALMTGIGWYSFFSEFLLLSLIGALFFGIYLDIFSVRKNENIFKRFLSTFNSLIIILGGSLLGLPRIITALDFVQISARAFGALGGTTFFGLGDFMNYFYPYFNLRDYGIVSFFKNGQFNVYVGFLTLIFGIVGLVNIKKVFAKFRPVAFFSFLFLVPWLMLFEFSYLFKLFKTVSFGIIGGSWKALFLSNFGLSILAGAGFDYFKSIKQDASRSLDKIGRSLTFFLGIFLSLVGGIKIIFWFGQNRIKGLLRDYFQANLFRPGEHSLEHYYKLIDDAFDHLIWQFSFLNYHFLVSTLLIIFSSLLLILFAKYKLGVKWMAVSAVFLVVLGPAFSWQGFSFYISKDFLTDAPKTAEYFKSREDFRKFRIFRFWPGLSDYAKLGLDIYSEQEKAGLSKELLTPNLNSVFGIESIEGDENFMSYRQSRFLAALGSFRSPQNDDKNWSKTNITLEEKLNKFNSAQVRNLLSVANVKFILSSFELPPPFLKIFQIRTQNGIPIYTYENPEVLPRAFFPENVVFESNASESFSSLVNIKNIHKTAVIECEIECYSSQSTEGGDTVELYQVEERTARLFVRTKKSRWLVFSQANLPTWQVWLEKDGFNEPLKIYSANYLFQAVYVPAGESEVVFFYPGFTKQFKFAFKRLLGIDPKLNL